MLGSYRICIMEQSQHGMAKGDRHTIMDVQSSISTVFSKACVIHGQVSARQRPACQAALGGTRDTA